MSAYSLIHAAFKAREDSAISNKTHVEFPPYGSFLVASKAEA